MRIHSNHRKTISSGNDQDMQVILGCLTVKAYVSAPKDFQVIGIVRFGQEYGLLGIAKSGAYFRINGSHNEKLEARAVEQAINKAKLNGRGDTHKTLRVIRVNTIEPVTPTVLLKRRRKIDPALTANSQLQPIAA
jgi:hypothetical protein